MGLIRKVTSVSTLGLVPYRNGGERATHFAKQTRNAARLNNVQNMQMIELQRQQLAAAAEAQVMRATQVAATQLGPVQVSAPPPQPLRQLPPALPAGWYPDPTDNRALTWWDGSAWNPGTKHYPGR